MQIMCFFHITRPVFKTIYYQSTFADILKKPTVLYYVTKQVTCCKHFENFRFRPKMNMTNTRNCSCVFKTNQQIENKLDKELFTVY